MKSVGIILVSVVLSAALAFSMLWGSLAIWFRLPAPDIIKYMAIAAFLFSGMAAIVQAFRRRTVRFLVIHALLLVAVLVWWQTIKPPVDADWAPAVARQVTGSIEGDTLTLENVRAFEWRTEEDFTEVWATRTYDLSKLETLDLFLSYWGDPAIAHFMLSFGFGNDEYLTWSVEVRREKDSQYSPVADFFKEHALVILASEEYDIVGMRSVIWENDVHVFRLNARKEVIRELIEGYVADANALAGLPEWYNSIFTNCTTVVFKTMDALGIEVPFDWRIIVNGYLPEMLYERGMLNTDYTVEDLRNLGRIADRGKAFGLKPGFSAAIREGVPSP